jgi:hypothetical protein
MYRMYRMGRASGSDWIIDKINRMDRIPEWKTKL